MQPKGQSAVFNTPLPLNSCVSCREREKNENFSRFSFCVLNILIE